MNGVESIGPTRRSALQAIGATEMMGKSYADMKPSGVIIVDAHGTPVTSLTSRVAYAVSGWETSRSAPTDAAEMSS